MSKNWWSKVLYLTFSEKNVLKISISYFWIFYYFSYVEKTRNNKKILTIKLCQSAMFKNHAF